MKPTLITAATMAAFSLGLCACGGGSSDTASTTGAVYMGPVRNATIEVHEIAADGTVAERASVTAKTIGDGSFSLDSLRYPLLVRVTGGAYEEEANGASASLTAELDAVFLSPPSKMVVSAYSNAIVSDARAAGGLTASNITAAMTRINALAGDIDVQQTLPAFVAAGATATVSDSAKMALALGAESQSRTDSGVSILQSTLDIVAQAANGDTIVTCHANVQDVATDGSVAESADSNCAIAAGARAYTTGTRNRSGILNIAALEAPQARASSTASSGPSCSDRVAVLAENIALFKRRQNEMQAASGSGITADNWKSYSANGFGSTWGPKATQYGAITVPAECAADPSTFKRELLLAVENYWVDQGINYCYHHIPGWLPPTSPARFRNSSAGSTSGGSASGMTCTAQRKNDGSQVRQVFDTNKPDALMPDVIQWQGVDCSDFTSWVYNFSGLTAADAQNMETGISTQACSTGDDPLNDHQQQPGVLLDINHANFDAMSKYLLPGDLLYITQSNVSAAGAKITGSDNTFQLAHVVTWTGKRFSELRNGPDGDRYDPARIGQPGSRLGGDLQTYVKYPVSELGTKGQDPYMIIDSHYAGPAYRPFEGWYANDLSDVRRIVDAEAVYNDPVLAPFIIKREPGDGKVLTFSSEHARKSDKPYRMVYLTPPKQIPTCYRTGKPADN